MPPVVANVGHQFKTSDTSPSNVGHKGKTRDTSPANVGHQWKTCDTSPVNVGNKWKTSDTSQQMWASNGKPVKTGYVTSKFGLEWENQ